MTSSPNTPDERDLLDFADAVNAGQNLQPTNDIERTYLHVQRALQGESAAIPSTTKQSTWEDVMSTLAITPEAPVSNRTRRQQGLSNPVRAFRPKRVQWTPLASVAAAALMIIASFGVWFTSGNEPSQPPIAPQMAGITSNGEIAQAPATPDATAIETETGTVTVPIISGVDEQPMAGPVVWLTTTGEVLYDDGSGEVTTIATDATHVMSQTTNVIRVTTDDPESDWVGKDGQEYDGNKLTYHHLISGKTLVDDKSFSSYLGGPNTFGPLTVLTITDAPREWSIVNFETMESKSIAEITGGQFRSSDPISVAVSDDLSTIAIATSQYQSEASQILYQQSGLPGEVAVIPADLNDVSWVSVPEDMPAVGNILLSPDGSEVAFISTERTEAGSTMTISIVDVATGEELSRTEPIQSNYIINFTWLPDGDGFVIIGGGKVQKFAHDGSESTVLFEAEGDVTQLPNMAGSDLIYLEATSISLDESTPVPESTQLVILNPVTGERIEIDGKPWFQGMSFPVTLRSGLVPIPVSQDGLTAQLVHPITGEVFTEVVANVDDPMMRPDFDPVAGEPIPWFQTVTTTMGADSPVSIVELADGNLAAVTITADSMDIRTIEGPEGSEGLQVMLSQGGTYLTIGAGWEQQGEDDAYYLLDLSDPDSDWVQGTPGERIDFVELDNE